MAKQKEIVGQIKLQIPGGGATPAPPVGPALGAKGVNIGEFVKRFNDATAQDARRRRAGRHHRLQGQVLRLHHEGATGC